LAEGFGSQKLPGVGFSIGLTRIMAKESQHAEAMAEYPQTVTDFCLILDAQTEDPEALLEAGKRLQKQHLSVNTISVAKLKKGLQIASRTGASIALFMFDRRVVMKHLASGEQVDLPTDQSFVDRARDFLQRK
jgi:histidyl-tRNA synthetase